MSSEYKAPSPEPSEEARQPTSEHWGPWQANDEVVQSPDPSLVTPSKQTGEGESQAQFVHREHVSGMLPYHPSEAPRFRAAYGPYPAAVAGYPPHPGGYPAYPGYSPAPGSPMQGYGYAGYSTYGWQAPRHDGYLLGMAITTMVGAIIAILVGLASLALLAFTLVLPSRGALPASQLFSSSVQFIAYGSIGIIGGFFGFYHSLRSMLRRPTAPLALPQFWIFLLLYVVVLAIGLALRANGLAVSIPALTILLIMLAAIFPAVTLLALGVRRLRFPNWSTTWRRFTVALVSGGTLGIALAALFELVALFVQRDFAVVLSCLGNPGNPTCQNPSSVVSAFILVAVIAPLVEESVKPLAVAIFIGRVNSAAEAFVLGLAAGIGFNLIETVGYISLGYQDWLQVALLRTGAGLLHGFGAAMVALGWYYLTHAKKQRFLLAIGCWLYAVLQHALWNGTASLVLLPAPIGPTINSWSLNLGFATLAFTDLLNIIEALLFLAIFIFVTGKLRPRKLSMPLAGQPGTAPPSGTPQIAVQA
ncbi:MAG: PrsW family glutamic-type intramembrane protease [Chloroflexota bacterium]|nr:PrsW family glutamic-type intramembrane protease [Chloroflexota bacterium]